MLEEVLDAIKEAVCLGRDAVVEALRQQGKKAALRK